MSGTGGLGPTSSLFSQPSSPSLLSNPSTPFGGVGLQQQQQQPASLGSSVQPGSNVPLISFDEFGKIRVLEATKFEASLKLKEESKDFRQRISDFNGIVESLLSVINDKAQQIEAKKLQAVAQRNRVEHETENRKSRQTRLKSLIKENQAELDRLAAHLESLQKVESEQQTFMDGIFSR